MSAVLPVLALQLLVAQPADDTDAVVGTLLDPVDGSIVTPVDREWLPNARQLGNLADFWFLEVVNGQNSGGGIAAFDPLYTSAHGRSYTLTGHYWNDLDITDPSRPGEPLMSLPYFAWDSIQYRSLNTERPGFHIRFSSELDSGVWARAAGGGAVGGPTWIPGGVFDREPGFDYGASTSVRELDRATEFDVQTGFSGEWGSFRAIAERIDHQHQYPTLVDPSTGLQLDDEAVRTTAMLIGALSELPLELLVAFQRSERSHEDGQFRLPLDLTSMSASDSVLAQISSRWDFAPNSSLTLAAGLATKREERDRRGEGPIVTDIEEEWFWLARPRLGERLNRERFNFDAVYTRDDDEWPYALSLRLTQGNIRSTPEQVEFAGTTYLAGETPAVSILAFDPYEDTREWVRNARLQFDGEWQGETRWNISYALGLDYSAVGARDAGTTLDFVGVGAGVVADYRAKNGSRWFFILRREPQPLTFQHAQFLNPARPSGTQNRWLDDGDLIPTADEVGPIQSRFGGDTRVVPDGLNQWTSNHFAFGWESPIFGAFKSVLTGVARFELDPITVRLAGEAADSYSRRLVEDPETAIRGTERSDAGQGFTPIFDRSPGTNGTELYALENRDRPNLYIGAELQLVSVEQEWWFLNLQAKGYWNIGSAAYGNYPDRNDAGIISESSATLNERINQRGRFDHDRSFGIKLQTGVEPIEGLRSSLALRYRDGQPFARFFTTDAADGIDPGAGLDPTVPVTQMAVWRGGVRYTFHMWVDARLRYDLPTSLGEVAFVLDAYNLFGSSTEITEDPRTGPTFRRALEVVPNRAFLLSVEFAFL